MLYSCSVQEKELKDKIHSINYELKKVTGGCSAPQKSNPPTQRQKKSRTVFTKRQILKLESMFYAKRYLSNTDRIELSKNLNLSESQVKVWFQNRRNKWKRDMAFKLECAKFNSEQIIPDIDVTSNYFDVRNNNHITAQHNSLSDCCYGDTTLLVPSLDTTIRCYTQLK